MSQEGCSEIPRHLQGRGVFLAPLSRKCWVNFIMDNCMKIIVAFHSAQCKNQYVLGAFVVVLNVHYNKIIF